MYNYFSHDINTFLIAGDKILVFNGKNLINTINHTSELTFLKYNLVFSKEKILYKISENKLEEIIKLPKSISQISKYEDKIFIADRNSTIYKLSNTAEEITSNISYVTDMVVNENIYIADKYGRVRVSQYSGDILDYIFVDQSPILSLASTDNDLIAAGNNFMALIKEKVNKIKIEGKINKILIKNKIILILDDKVLVKDNIKDILNIEDYVEHKIDDILDGIIVEENVFLLGRDGTVYFNFDKIYNTENNYNDYFSHLNK